MNKKLKLYVWTKFEPIFADGLAFAIAESKEAAQESIEKALGYKCNKWGEVKIKSLSKCAYGVIGGA